MKQKCRKNKMLSYSELSLFFTSLGMLLQAGVRLDTGVGMLAENMQGGKASAFVERCNKLFATGKVFELSKALEKTGGVPEYAIQILGVAEVSGQLADTTSALGEYYNTQEQLSQTVKSAVSAPLSILGSMGAVLAFFSFAILPMFQQVFSALGISSAGVSSFAFVFARVSVVVVCLLFAVCLAFVLFRKNKNVSHFVGKIKPFKKIYSSIGLSRFTQGLSMLLSSGIGAEEALEKAKVFLQNDEFSPRLKKSIQLVSEGNSIEKVLVSENILQGFEAKILIAASQTGNSEEALRKISEMFLQDANDRISKMLEIIEPVLVAVLSLAVGGALLAVLVPLVDMVRAL